MWSHYVNLNHDCKSILLVSLYISLLAMPLVVERTSSRSVRSSLDLSTGRRWQPQTGRPTATPARRHMATCNLTWLRFPYKISPSGPHMLGFGPLLSSWNIPPAPCALFLPPENTWPSLVPLGCYLCWRWYLPELRATNDGHPYQTKVKDISFYGFLDQTML